MNGYQFSTLLIAGGAFVLGAISLGWTVILHIWSKPKVSVYASIRRIYPTPLGMNEDDSVLIVTAVNARSRTVTIVSFCGVFERPDGDYDQFFMKGSAEPLADLAAQLPHQLREGEQACLYQILDDEHGLRKRGVKYFFVYDTLGRKWRSKKNPLGKQLKDVKKTQEGV